MSLNGVGDGVGLGVGDGVESGLKREKESVGTGGALCRGCVEDAGGAAEGALDTGGEEGEDGLDGSAGWYGSVGLYGSAGSGDETGFDGEEGLSGASESDGAEALLWQDDMHAKLIALVVFRSATGPLSDQLIST